MCLCVQDILKGESPPSPGSHQAPRSSKTGPRDSDVELVWHQAEGRASEDRTPVGPLHLLGSLGTQVAMLPACLSGAGVGTQQACRAGQDGVGFWPCSLEPQSPHCTELWSAIDCHHRTPPPSGPRASSAAPRGFLSDARTLSEGRVNTAE